MEFFILWFILINDNTIIQIIGLKVNILAYKSYTYLCGLGIAELKEDMPIVY